MPVKFVSNGGCCRSWVDHVLTSMLLKCLRHDLLVHTDEVRHERCAVLPNESALISFALKLPFKATGRAFTTGALLQLSGHHSDVR